MIFGYVGPDLFAGPIQGLYNWNDKNGPRLRGGGDGRFFFAGHRVRARQPPRWLKKAAAKRPGRNQAAK
jgi:hypothetical protein